LTDGINTLETSLAATRPGYARMDRLKIGPQVANLPHKAFFHRNWCPSSVIELFLWQDT
jgi:hypothetical protein